MWLVGYHVFETFETFNPETWDPGCSRILVKGHFDDFSSSYGLLWFIHSMWSYRVDILLLWSYAQLFTLCPLHPNIIVLCLRLMALVMLVRIIKGPDWRRHKRGTSLTPLSQFRPTSSSWQQCSFSSGCSPWASFWGAAKPRGLNLRKRARGSTTILKWQLLPFSLLLQRTQPNLR